MKGRTRIVTLVVLALLIALCLTLGVTRAFLKQAETGDSTTEITLNSCAKIVLKETGTKINLDNTAPMSANAAMQNLTPYEFRLESYCEDGSSYNLYLGNMPVSSPLNPIFIKYAILNKDTHEVIIMDNLGNRRNAEEDFQDFELTQIKTSLGESPSTIYNIYSGNLASNTSEDYLLYMWVDELAGNEVANQNFAGAVLAKDIS